MALSALDDKSQAPTEKALAKVLGPAKGLWDDLVSSLAFEYPPLAESWSYSGKPWGWSLALKQKKRTVLYLTPAETFFYAGLALGEKAVAAARRGGLSAAVLEILDSSRRYAEGRAVRLEVHTAEDVRQVIAIAAAKMQT